MPHAGGAVVVDVDVVGIVGVLDQAIGVRTAAGLDDGELHGVIQVADVPDAHASCTVRVRHVRGSCALRPAVDAAGHILDGSEHEGPEDVDVTLSARAQHAGPKGWVRRVGDVVDLDPAPVAVDGVVAGERQVGVRRGDVEAFDALRVPERTIPLVEHAHLVEAELRGPGVVEARAQTDAGVVGRRQAIRRLRARRGREQRDQHRERGDDHEHASGAPAPTGGTGVSSHVRCLPWKRAHRMGRPADPSPRTVRWHGRRRAGRQPSDVPGARTRFPAQFPHPGETFPFCLGT